MTASTLVEAVTFPVGQGPRQLGELALAFLLSGVIGLEREPRGKSAGLRTQTIVGTTAALLVLVSKYGFSDVLLPGHVVLDPSRVAAQIVSGVGFLGAGLILTRRGTVLGLTTAAAVWEVAGIGMAAGAGLPIIAVTVTALHFVAVFALTGLAHRLPGTRAVRWQLRLTYLDGHGVLRPAITACTAAGWQVVALTREDAQPLGEGDGGPDATITVRLGLAGRGDVDALIGRVGGLPGVQAVDAAEGDGE